MSRKKGLAISVVSGQTPQSAASGLRLHLVRPKLGLKSCRFIGRANIININLHMSYIKKWARLGLELGRFTVIFHKIFRFLLG